MMYSEEFVNKVKLLLKCLPAIRARTDFAIKGGTAINLLMQDLPRLSVDIDLTYCHIHDRPSSLAAMHQGLNEIGNRIKQLDSSFKVQEKYGNQKNIISKLFVYHENTMIKIEPNFIMRGTLHPITMSKLCNGVNKEFNVFLDNIPMVSETEVYAGKICAALNRQHPRDLFDIKILMENGGITNEIRQAFVIYLAGDSRPMHELLSPNRLEITKLYENEFSRMTKESLDINELLDVRESIINYVKNKLTENERNFLLSVKQGEPGYSLMPFNDLESLPSLQWKVMNIRRMDKMKRGLMLDKLKLLLSM